jgi:erythromycin esterase-like protein
MRRVGAAEACRLHAILGKRISRERHSDGRGNNYGTDRSVRARPGCCATRDLGPLLERIDDARFVLLGEASHGTAEYYTWRAELSRRLIIEKGFHFIAVEGDWPACDHRDRYIEGARRRRG